MTTKLSVIIPVYNEADQVSSLVRHLDHFQDEAIEVLFVDGGSQDQTADLLEEEGYQVVKSLKGRGHQLNDGAQKARGDALLFLHADSYFKTSPVGEILQVLTEADFGAFPLRFEPNSCLLRMIAMGSNWRIKHRQIAFGDQGMFMTKAHYHRLGGFRPLPLMEDYDLSIRNKEHGRGILLAKTPIYTSSRRFKRQGTMRTLMRMQYCQWLFRRGATIEEIQAIYSKNK